MKNSVLLLAIFSMYSLYAMDGDQQTVPMQEMGDQHLVVRHDHPLVANYIVTLMREGKSVHALDELMNLVTFRGFNREQLIVLQGTIGKATPRASWLTNLSWLSTCSATALTIIFSRDCVENSDCLQRSNLLFLSSFSFVMGSISGILAHKLANNYKEEFQRTQTTMLAKINTILRDTP